MAITPFFWMRTLENHGSRGLALALIIGFVVYLIFYVILHFVLPSLFELSYYIEVFGNYIIMILGLVIFFLLYWRLVVKNK